MENMLIGTSKNYYILSLFNWLITNWALPSTFDYILLTCLYFLRKFKLLLMAAAAHYCTEAEANQRRKSQQYDNSKNYKFWNKLCDYV
jgi:hypothetical protein